MWRVDPQRQRIDVLRGDATLQYDMFLEVLGRAWTE